MFNDGQYEFRNHTKYFNEPISTLKKLDAKIKTLKANPPVTNPAANPRTYKNGKYTARYENIVPTPVPV